MKTLADGVEVSSRSYYYLLDWNELNECRYMADTFNKGRLKDLNIVEYSKLFEHATWSEMAELNKLM